MLGVTIVVGCDRPGPDVDLATDLGVSRNQAMVKLIEDAIGTKLNVSPEAHFCGALGAALFARDHAFGLTAEQALA